jgi:hypothetical protein
VEGLLLITSLIAAQSVASGNSKATRAVTQAYYKQSGVESMFNDFQKRELNPEARAYLGHAAFIAKTLVDQRVVFTWRFP